MTPPLVTQMRYRMGTLFEIRLWSDSKEQARHAMEAAFEEIRQIEQRFSRFDPASETSFVNRHAAREPVRVSETFMDLTLLSMELSRKNDGAFDITAGAWNQLWQRAFERQRLPERSEQEEAGACVGWQQVETDLSKRIIRFHRPGLTLDFGGIGKGYALDRAVEQLQRQGIPRGWVDAGGNFKVFGFEEMPSFGIEHPLTPDRLWAVADLVRPAVASSSNRLRTLLILGKHYGHIVNPRSGWPLTADSGTTVLAESAALADACSTALLVLGPEGLTRLTTLQAEGLVLTRSRQSEDGLEARMTATLRHHITPLEPTEVSA